MEDVSIVGLDLAKRVFQVHGATSNGRVVCRKKLSRGQLRAFFAQLPPFSAIHYGVLASFVPIALWFIVSRAAPKWIAEVFGVAFLIVAVLVFQDSVAQIP